MAIKRDEKEPKVTPEPKVEEKVEEKVEPTSTDKLLWKMEEMQKKIERLESAPKPEEKKEVPDFDIDAIALRTKADLMKQDKVKLRVPFNPMGTGDALIPININGFRWFLKPGETVEVPEEIAKIFEESYDRTAMANSRVKVENAPM